MKQEIKIEELKRENIFKVHENYFEELPFSILNHINLPQKQQNFNVPAKYFDNLSDKILARINQDSKKKIELDSLPKINIFRVPDLFFELQEEEILSKTVEKQAKIIKINWWQNNKIRWSAAASVVILIGFLWAFLPNFSKSETELALNKISNEEINHYLENQDLSLLEYEAVEVSKKNPQNTDNQLLQHIKLNEKDILEHLETEEIEEI